jgi:hypothetical protein
MIGAVAGRRAVPDRGEATVAAVAAQETPRSFAAESLRVAAAYLVETDPFRVDRRPSSVAYRPDLEGAPPPPPRPPKPTLVLRGIIGGPPWEAIVDGVPERSTSTVLRQGDVVGALRVRAVGRDTVVIQGADTTWRLTMRRDP